MSSPRELVNLDNNTRWVHRTDYDLLREQLEKQWQKQRELIVQLNQYRNKIAELQREIQILKGAL